MKSLRYNDGKLRLELIPPKAMEEVAKVMTYGAEKYTVRDSETGEVLVTGADNWKKGQPWMSVIASAKRHIEKFVQGEDYDPESQTLHVANAVANLLFILEFYKIYPQGDNRPHHYLKEPRVGLDIDEVLADFIGHWVKRFGGSTPDYWHFDRDMKSKFEILKNDKDFWLSVPVKTSPKDIPFEPACYITSRSIPTEWTEEWLDKNGFSAAPVYSVGYGESKVAAAKDAKIDIYVDDRFTNFVELNKAGICCYLFDAPHNQRYSVGYKRVKNLSELPV